MGKRFVILLALVLVGCGGSNEDPKLFLPRVVGPEGADLDVLRARYCQGVNVSLGDDFLTPENFRSIFNCANYDKSLEDLKPLFTSAEFPEFLRNMNLILGSSNTEELRETLRPWLEEGPQGTSRLDRLLPILAKVVKNPSFQQGLPLLHEMLEAGENIWRELLPGLADLLYQERFPDNFLDISLLLEELSGENRPQTPPNTNGSRLSGAPPEGPASPAPPENTPEKDYATEVKRWAEFLQARLEGKTVSLRALELAYRMKEIQLQGTSIQEYLDHMNEKGVFVSLYLDSGAVRGEVINPKLNTDPDPEEIRDGLQLTPEERQERAYRKLFARGPGGEDAPIVQLAALIEELHRSHPEFLPSLARWFSANGAKITQWLLEYVVRAQVISNLNRLSLDNYLTSYAQEQNVNIRVRVSAEEFVAFLKGAFSSPSFTNWLNSELLTLNREQFGPRNGELMRGSVLRPLIVDLYNLPAVPEFGATLIPGSPLALNSAIKRFSNLHRSRDKLEVEYRGSRQGLEQHLLDVWWSAARDTLGEAVVIDFALKLAQTLFTEMAADFSRKNMTLAEWYYSSPYGDPGTTEAVAGYAFIELGMLEKIAKNKDYLKGEFAQEVFPGPEGESDRRAFRMVVDQIPHIWIYIKSGMSRSGNDLTRALASKDRGFLIRRYVDLVASASASGWIRDGVRLIEAYHEKFPSTGPGPEVSDGLEERRRVSKGADALKRVMRSLFEPETKGNYATSTLGRILTPISSLVSPERRAETERFLLTSAAEVRRIPDEKINNFLRDLFKKSDETSVAKTRETLKATSELLRDPIFPTVIRQLTRLFEEDAVKPALDFLARKIDDGSLQSVLLFLRRVLGFRG